MARCSGRIGWSLAIALLAGAILIVSLKTTPLPRVRLADGGELQVVKVDWGSNSVCSAESGWKRALRRLTPRTWEQPLLGTEGLMRFRTRHDSLLVWVRITDAGGQVVTAPRVDRPGVAFAGGFRESGHFVAKTGGFGCIELRVFPRDAARVRLTMEDAGKEHSFEVENPQPSLPRKWTASGLPQTNRFPTAEIILADSRSQTVYRPRLQLRSRGPSRPGWVAWRVVAFDPLGNWSEDGWPSTYSTPVLKPLPPAAMSWRIVAEGVEYVSAGFVPSPVHGSINVLTLSERATELGVRYLVVVGGGAFRIENGEASLLPDVPVGRLTRSEVRASTVPGATNWTVELKAVGPGILCISEADRPGPPLRARMRERDEQNQGRVFTGNVANTTVVAGGARWDVQFFAQRLMDSTNRLEVEIVGNLPPAEFFIDRPVPVARD